MMRTMALTLTLVAGCVSGATPTVEGSDHQAAIAALEAQIGGRVGVYAFGPSGELLAHRADERFAMCSTFKWPLAAAVFRAVADGRLALDERLPISESDLVFWSPVTEKLAPKGGASVLALAAAAVQLSDNTAANLLLARLGGLQAFNDFMRSVGDEVTRLDRREPELNSNLPGDERDTTSPRAMAHSIQATVTAEGPLPEALRLRLVGLLAAVETGNRRIRAGTPPDWLVGNKTGTCGTAYNDIAVIWPVHAAPYAIAIYIDRPTAGKEAVEAAIARIAQMAAAQGEMKD